MSENLKKLREEKKEYLKGKLPRWHGRYEELSGMSKIEDLERKAEEARKEEQRIKQELREIIGNLIVDLHHLVGEEESDYRKYMTMAANYSALPTVYDTLKRMALEEQLHAKYIRELINRLESELPGWKKK